MGKTFNLAETFGDALRAVPSSGTGREQIEYIDEVLISGDARNFYELSGLEEFAANIELIGLQQPIRVRPDPDDVGGYIIVSGHRRMAAIRQYLKPEAPDKWAQIPCIVERDDVSPAMQELRLLMGNAGNRKMTQADELQQAERTSNCIRLLEDEGYEFPGRHRDWVSKISGMSRSKLSRLEAIKNNMVEGLLAYFRAGKISEAAAYELQKLPAAAQELIAASCERSGDASFISMSAAQYAAEKADAYMAPRTCKGGGACDHHEKRFLQALRDNSWHRCSGGCCLSCSDLPSCAYPCSKGKAKNVKRKDDEAKEKADRKARSEKEGEQRQRDYRLARQREAQRLVAAIEAAGLGDDDQLPGEYSYQHQSVADVRKAAAGNFGDDHFYSASALPCEASRLCEVADLLGCSLDYLAGRTDELRPAAGGAQAAPLAGWPRWISVEERLPEPGVDVLTVDADGDVGVDWRWSDGTFDDDLTHWMPLPPPPGAEPDVAEVVEPRPVAVGWTESPAVPDHDCTCAVVVELGGSNPGKVYTDEVLSDWHDGAWCWRHGRDHKIDMPVLRWVELPEDRKGKGVE